MKLFTVPFAGGSANYYSRWKRMVNRNIDIVPIELAGRGNRVTDPLYVNINEAVFDVFEQIKNEIISFPYSLFGHSMGALISFELAHFIYKKGLPIEHLFISGMCAPELKDNKKAIHLLDKDDFIKEIIEMGGTNKEVFESSELTDYFIPIIRNDLSIVHNYKYESERIPLSCGFSIFTGKGDEYTTEQTSGWNKYTTGSCKFYKFGGGHFFINEEIGKISSIINQTLN